MINTLRKQLSLNFGNKIQGKTCKKHPENDWVYARNMSCVLCVAAASSKWSKTKRAAQRRYRKSIFEYEKRGEKNERKLSDGDRTS